MSCQAALGTPSTGERNLKIISDAQNRPHHYVGFISPATRTEFCNSLFSRCRRATLAHFGRLGEAAGLRPVYRLKSVRRQDCLPHKPPENLRGVRSDVVE